MSSDESRTTSSSRLSQFGLYRTIDARTEEFLRLSRKRQIRQGCACAAVSTAITVTVVVTVLLVYEYGINLDAKSDQKQSKKQNWFGLFNDSTAFDSKLNKAKINFHPSTLKLLPLILKALNHNKYLEKFFEDPSSSPMPSKRTPIDLVYSRHAHNNGKNRILNPKSDYRTAQLYKDNQNYFSKARKMRDRQRVRNYFDKMVGDKVGPVFTEIPETTDVDAVIKMIDVADSTEFETDESASTGTTTKNPTTNPTTPPTRKTTKTIKITKISKQLNPIETAKENKNTTARKYRGTLSNVCKCPKNFSTLLNRLISTFQELLPEISIAKSRCVEKEKAVELLKEKEKPEIKITTTTLRPSRKPKLTTVKIKSTTKLTTTAFHTNKWYFSYAKLNNTTTERSIESILFHDLLMPEFIRRYTAQNTNNFFPNSIKSHENKKGDTNVNTKNIITFNRYSTTAKSYLDAPLTRRTLKPDFTEPLKNYITTAKGPSITSEPVNTTTINNNKIETTTQQTSTTLKTPEKNTSTSVINLKEVYESIQNQVIKNRNTEAKDNLHKSDAIDQYSRVNINDLNLFSLKRMGDLIIPSRLPTSTEFSVKIKPFSTEKSLINYYNSDMNRINANDEKVSRHEKTWEEDGRKITEDDFQVQEILKHVDSVVTSPSYNKYSPMRYNDIDDDTKQSDTITKKNEQKLNKDKKEHITGALNSMLPENRPTYLEINRHPDFKFEAPHDEYHIRNAYIER